MGQLKSLYGSRDFVSSYRVYVYDQEHNFDTHTEADNFVEECESEGMEVELCEVNREDMTVNEGDFSDTFSDEESELLIYST